MTQRNRGKKRKKHNKSASSMEGNESANKSGSVASNEESRTMATDHYMSDLHESMKSLH